MTLHIEDPGCRPTNCLIVLPWGLEHSGGVNEVVINLHREFTKNSSIHTAFLIFQWNYPSAIYRDDSGRDIFHLRLRGLPQWGRNFVKEMVAFVFGFPNSLWQLYSLLKNNRIDIVNIHFPGYVALYFALLKKFFPNSFRFILSFHGSDVSAMELNSLYASIMGWVMQYADGITTPSLALADKIAELVPSLCQKAQCIYNGVDNVLFQSCKTDFPFLPAGLQNKPFILNIGSFEHIKGHDILLKAFSKLCERRGDLNLLLVGKRGRLTEQVKARIDNSGLADRIFVLENISHDHIPWLMKNAVFFVLPSRSEGFPLVLLEAGSARLAVIASRVGGIPELIQDGVNGLLITPEDPDQLATAMIRLMENDLLRREIAQNLFQTVSSNFSWEKTATEYARMLFSPRMD